MTCKVTEERNGLYELEMTYPVTGIHYGKLGMGRIIFATPADGKNRQAFRIYKITKPINGIVTVLARHISYQLSFIPVKTDYMAATSASIALMQLKADALEECPFDFWTDVDTNATYNTTEAASLRSRLGGTSGSILDTYGGEYEWDNWTVKLWKARGTDKGISILYGKNLTDLKQEESIENVVTGIYPFWRKEEDGEVQEVTLSSPVYAENTKNFPFHRTIVMDFSQEWEEKPTEAQLRQRTEQYIKTNHPEVPDVNLTVSFAALWQSEEYKNVAALERVNLCDTVTVRFPTLGVDAKAKVIKTVYDCLKERYETIEMGTSRTNLSDILSANREEAAADNKRTESFLKAALEHATKLIQGGLGGHVVFVLDADGKPNEILIMDTDDMNTAVNVIRMNMAGIGFSDNGYNGPFKTAWTIDSQFVADFITTGTLRAGLIKAGVLSDKEGKNYWNMETGDFRLSANTQVGDSTVATQTDISDVSKDLKANAIQSVDVEYAQGDSQTEPPEDGWQTNAPTWQEGKFIWQRTATTMADVTVAYSKALCITGIKGETGNGVQATSVTYGVSASASVQPESWADAIPASITKGEWLWVRTLTTYTDGSKNTFYTKSYAGTDGEDGKSVYIRSIEKKGGLTTVELTDGTDTQTLTIKDGTDGTDGINGTDGTNSYIHIAWSNASDGSAGFSTSDSKDKAYIGVYTDSVKKDSESASDYSWSLIKGADGHSPKVEAVKSGDQTVITIDGVEAATIKDGADGQSIKGDDAYLHIAYAASADGKDRFSTSWFASAVYIGVRSDHTKADSETYTDYDWSLMKGADGKTPTVSAAKSGTKTNIVVNGELQATIEDGADGTGVSATVEQYYLSSSNTSQSGGSWSETSPAWVSGHYIWTRSKITWTDGEITYTSPVLAQAINTANENASAAQKLAQTVQEEADKKVQVFYSSSAPIFDMDTGDLWIDTDDNQMYRYDGTEWKSVQDSQIQEALESANDAQETADKKITCTASSTVPSGATDGDLWIQTANRTNSDGSVNTYSGAIWRFSSSDNKWHTWYDSRADALADAAKAYADEQDAALQQTISNSLTQQEIFNRLTNNGTEQGIYLENGKLYINGTYLKTGTLDADLIKTGNLLVGGTNKVGEIDLYNGSTHYGTINSGGIDLNATLWGSIRYLMNPNIFSGFSLRSAADGSGKNLSFDTDDILLKNNDSTTMFGYGQKYAMWIYAGSDGVKQFMTGTNTTYPNILIDGSDGSITAKVKSRIIETEDYGRVLTYCYETPSPMFGDVGEGEIGEDGKAYVQIDPAFSETISTNQYQVFLQKYGEGECYVSERHGTYFIVEGTAGLSFGWEMKAKQIDLDQLRLESAPIPIQKDDTSYGIDAANYIQGINEGRTSV